MSNLLTKDPIITIIPGHPAIPAQPETSYFVPYTGLSNSSWLGTGPSTETFGMGSGLFLAIFGGGAAHTSAPSGTSSINTPQGYYVTVPAVPYQPATPDQVISDPNEGWNASANSIATLPGNSSFEARFVLPNYDIGAICGVGPVGGNPFAYPTYYFSMNRGVLTVQGDPTPISHTNGVTLRIVGYPKLGVTEWWVGTQLVLRQVPAYTPSTLTQQQVFGTTAPVSAFGAADIMLAAQLYLAGDVVDSPVLTTPATITVQLTMEPLQVVSGQGTPPNAVNVSMKTLQLLAFATQPLTMLPLQIVAGMPPPQGANLTFKYMTVAASTRPAGLTTFTPVYGGASLSTQPLQLRCGTIAPLQLRSLKILAGRATAQSDLTMLPLGGAANMVTEDNTSGLMFAVVGTQAPTTGQAILAVAFSQALGAAVVVTATPMFGVTITSRLGLTDSQLARQVARALAMSTVNLPGSPTALGDPGTVWVVNVETGATSTYTNFDFNSFAKIGPLYYGARADGIYALDEDDDPTPVVGRLGFGELRFGTTAKNRVPDVYLGIASTGNMFLKVIADGVPYIYRSARSDANAITAQRIKLGRGLSATSLAFELYNDDGTSWELDTVEFNSIDLSRRI